MRDVGVLALTLSFFFLAWLYLRFLAWLEK